MNEILRMILIMLITANTALAVYGFVRERNRYNRLRDARLLSGDGQ